MWKKRRKRPQELSFSPKETQICLKILIGKRLEVMSEMAKACFVIRNCGTRLEALIFVSVSSCMVFVRKK